MKIDNTTFEFPRLRGANLEGSWIFTQSLSDNYFIISIEQADESDDLDFLLIYNKINKSYLQIKQSDIGLHEGHPFVYDYKKSIFVDKFKTLILRMRDFELHNTKYYQVYNSIFINLETNEISTIVKNSEFTIDPIQETINLTSYGEPNIIGDKAFFVYNLNSQHLSQPMKINDSIVRVLGYNNGTFVSKLSNGIIVKHSINNYKPIMTIHNESDVIWTLDEIEKYNIIQYDPLFNSFNLSIPFSDQNIGNDFKEYIRESFINNKFLFIKDQEASTNSNLLLALSMSMFKVKVLHSNDVISDERINKDNFAIYQFKFPNITFSNHIKYYIATLNDNRVRVRKNHSLQSDVLGYVNKGDKVIIVAKSEREENAGSEYGWSYMYKIRRISDNLEGWCFGKFLDFSIEQSSSNIY